jgi:hypothetical protein
VPPEIFFRRANRLTSSIKEADAPPCRPHSRSLSLAHAQHAGPTTGPRTAVGTAPCHPPPRPHLAPHRCSVLAGFPTSTLAPSALPLFELTASCRSRRRRPSLCDAAAAPLSYKRSKAVTNPIISPSTPSRFTPLAEPLLTSPAHSRDEAPTVNPLPRAVPRQGEIAGSSYQG